MNANKPEAPSKALEPCDNYGGKLAGNFPCTDCGWLWSEHTEPVGRYVSYESLMRTGRAVKKRGAAIILHYAGDDQERKARAGDSAGKRILQFASGAIARDEQRLVLQLLSKVQSDWQYNNMLDWYRKEKMPVRAQAQAHAQTEQPVAADADDATDPSAAQAEEIPAE